MWSSTTKTIDEPLDDDEPEEKKEADSDEDAAVEDVKDDEPRTKKVEKTTWDWTLINDAKPIWTRKPSEIETAEYTPADFKVIVELWGIEDSKRKKFKKIISFK